MATGNRILEHELRLFEQHKQEWLQAHTGEFAVIGGTTICANRPSGLDCGSSDAQVPFS